MHHGPKKSLTEPHYEALLKDITKTKTMGAPKAPAPAGPVKHRVAARPQQGSARGRSFAGSEDELRRRAGGAPLLDIETFKSSVPLSWIGGCDGVASAYAVWRCLHVAALSARLLCAGRQRSERALLSADAVQADLCLACCAVLASTWLAYYAATAATKLHIRISTMHICRRASARARSSRSALAPPASVATSPS